MTTVISFILIFGALVFFHELGHLIFAKRAGILCREFAIGFGPKIFSFKNKETLYTIRLFPIGGYVKMAGEDGESVSLKPGQRVGLLVNPSGLVTRIYLDKFEAISNIHLVDVHTSDLEHELIIQGIDENGVKNDYRLQENCELITGEVPYQIAPYHRQFHSKKVGPRALAIFAGPAMNFLLAFVLLFVAGLFQGVQVNDPIMGKLVSDGIAVKAGFQKGDLVQSIDNIQIESWPEVVKYIQAHPGDPIKFQILRDGKTKTLVVTPESVDNQGKKIGRIGVYAPVEQNLLLSIKNAGVKTVDWTKQIIISFGLLITGKFSINDLSGPVGIYNYTDAIAQSGLINLLSWTALLSINLGIVNLLPLPALDGGRLLFFAVEALRGKPIDRQKEGLVHFVGFALLMLLMIVVTWNDIKNLFF